MFVEGWAPEYGAPFESEDELAPAEGSVDAAVEHTEWAPLPGYRSSQRTNAPLVFSRAC